MKNCFWDFLTSKEAWRQLRAVSKIDGKWKLWCLQESFCNKARIKYVHWPQSQDRVSQPKNIIFIGYFYHDSDLTVFLFHFGSSCIWFRSANISLLWLWPMCIFNACMVSNDFLQTPHFPFSINFWYSSQLPSWFFKGQEISTAIFQGFNSP